MASMGGCFSLGFIMGSNIRRSYRRDLLWKRVKALGEPCHICGLPINPSIPSGHPLSFEMDELIPVSKGGRPDIMGNVSSSHRCCNQWRSNKMMPTVNRIRAEALERYGPWRTPLEFVEKARAAMRNSKRPAPARHPDGLPTSREW